MPFELLDLQNPWWTSSTYSPAGDHHLRAILGSSHYLARPQLVQEYLEFGPGDIYVVRGARQVGKTTLIKEWISRLLAQGIPGPNILFLSCETLSSYEELRQILVHWIQSKGIDERLFLFLDEISLSRSGKGLFFGVPIPVCWKNQR